MRKNPINYFFAGCVAILFCSACSEIISKDITGKSIIVYGPADSLYSSTAAISFFWQADEDFENYHLQIVSPDYSSPTLIWDSTFRAFSKLLTLGSTDAKYTWRLNGVNEGSVSDTIERSFYVDASAPAKAGSLISSGDSLDANDSLKWVSHDLFLGQSYPTKDSVFISAANDSTNFLYLLVQPLGMNFYPLAVGSFGTGDYWWRVSSKDFAGNVSTSNLFHFYFR